MDEFKFDTNIDKPENLEIINLPPEPKLPILPSQPPQSSALLTGDELQKEKEKQEEDSIKLTLKLSRDELEGLKDSRKEDDQKLVRDIIDPSHGNIVDSKITNNDIDEWADQKTTDRSIKLPNSEVPKPLSDTEDLFVPIPKVVKDNLKNDTSIPVDSNIDPSIENALADMSTDDYQTAAEQSAVSAAENTKIVDEMSARSSSNLTQSEEDRLLASTASDSDANILKNIRDELEELKNKKKEIKKNNGSGSGNDFKTPINNDSDIVDIYISDNEFIDLPKIKSERNSELSEVSSDTNSLKIGKNVFIDSVVADSIEKSKYSIKKPSNKPGTYQQDSQIKIKEESFRSRSNTEKSDSDKDVYKSFRYTSKRPNRQQFNKSAKLEKKHQKSLSSINKVKKSLNNDVKDIERELIYIRNQPTHPRDRLKRKIKNAEIKSEALSKVLKIENDDIVNDLQEIREIPSSKVQKLKHNLNQFNYDLSHVKKEIITISDDDIILLSDAAASERETDGSDVDFFVVDRGRDKDWQRRQKILSKNIKQEKSSSAAESEVEVTFEKPASPLLIESDNEGALGDDDSSSAEITFTKAGKNIKRESASEKEKSDLEITGQSPLHPSRRMQRHLRNIKPTVEFTGQTPAHHRDRLQQQLRSAVVAGHEFTDQKSIQPSQNVQGQSTFLPQAAVETDTSAPIQNSISQISDRKPKLRRFSKRGRLLPTSHSYNLARKRDKNFKSWFRATARTNRAGKMRVTTPRLRSARSAATGAAAVAVAAARVQQRQNQPPPSGAYVQTPRYSQSIRPRRTNNREYNEQFGRPNIILQPGLRKELPNFIRNFRVKNTDAKKT